VYSAQIVTMKKIRIKKLVRTRKNRYIVTAPLFDKRGVCMSKNAKKENT